MITDAANPIFTGERQPDGSVTIERIGVFPVSRHLIKTTNGAGDVLTGGMLGSLLLGKNLSTAVRDGVKMVCYYIQQLDGSFPDT
jgi:sugar/nucleoside kinase (ribokinase family)